MGPNSQPGQGLVAGLAPTGPDPARAPEAGRFDGWLAVLDRYGVQHLILNKERDSKLLSLVRARPGWAMDFEDETSVLFSRSLAGVS